VAHRAITSVSFVTIDTFGTNHVIGVHTRPTITDKRCGSTMTPAARRRLDAGEGEKGVTCAYEDAVEVERNGGPEPAT
jgi:hypothetical protein